MVKIKIYLEEKTDPQYPLPPGLTSECPSGPEFRHPKRNKEAGFKACSNPQNDKRARFALQQKAGTEIIPDTAEKILPEE
jgi:hypothetical protein